MRATLLALLIACAACGDDAPAPGTLEVRIYGEDFIEEGIPADVFVDGWAVTFDKFLVAVNEVSATAGHDGVPFTDATQRVFDLSAASQGVGVVVLSAAVDGGLYDHLGFRIAPATAQAEVGNATAADRDLLATNGWSILVEGTATKGAETFSFSWGFDTDTIYSGCHTNADVDGGTGTSTITIHGDHLFYDDLFAMEPNVAFDLIAQADTDLDGDVTPAELLALDISTEERYQVGSTGIDNLWDFIAHQTSTVGHIDGEGHCDTSLQ